jgi:hypothetical protein
LVLVGKGNFPAQGELFLRGFDPVLILQSPVGRAVLGAGGLELYDKEDNRRLWAHLSQGEPVLALSQEADQIALSLATKGVFIWDHKGHFRASLGCNEDDVALTLLDSKQNTRIFLGNAQENDETKICILNYKEKNIWSAP